MTPQDLELSRRFFSPNGFWLWNYIIDPSVRYIVLFGGSSSGKSFAVAQKNPRLTGSGNRVYFHLL